MSFWFPPAWWCADPPPPHQPTSKTRTHLINLFESGTALAALEAAFWFVVLSKRSES